MGATLQLRPQQVRSWRLAAQWLTDDRIAGDAVDAARPGLPDTPPGSAALGACARCPSLTPQEFTRALSDDRSIVIAWGRRGSPQLVPSARLGVFTRGLLPDDEESWRATIAGYAVHLDTLGMTAGELVGLAAEAAHQVLDGRELTKRELVDAIRPLMPTTLTTWFDPDTLGRFTAMLTRVASLHGGFVLVPRHDGEASFVRTDQWLGTAPDDDPAEARIEMARTYLAYLGPSRPQVFADWAGIGLGHAKRAFEALGDELVSVRIEGADGVLLSADAEAITEGAPAVGVRLLPPHDAYLSSLDRRVIVPDVARHKALWKAAGNPGAVLVDGEIDGSWRAHMSNGTLLVDVTEFRTLPKRAYGAIEGEAKRIGAIKGARKVKVRI